MNRRFYVEMPASGSREHFEGLCGKVTRRLEQNLIVLCVLATMAGCEGQQEMALRCPAQSAPLQVVPAARLSFSPPQVISSGRQEYGFANNYPGNVGDLNGDGKADLILRNGGVRVLLGNGDGTFQPPSALPQSAGYEELTIGDVDADCIPDLSTSLGETLSVLLGRGDSTFSDPVKVLYQAHSPYSIVRADFNQDGLPDLAAGSFFESDDVVGVFLLQANRRFTAPVDYAMSIGELTVGDFNGDGKQDLVGRGSRSDGTPKTMSVLWGQGNGTFQSPAVSVSEYSTSILAVGDLNGDGLDDIVAVEDTAPNANPPRVARGSVFLGGADRAFTMLPFGSQEGDFSVAIADFDGDGRKDVAVTNDGGWISFHLGNGDGTFQTPTKLTPGVKLGKIVATRIDSDARTDVVLLAGLDAVVLLNRSS